MSDEVLDKGPDKFPHGQTASCFSQSREFRANQVRATPAGPLDGDDFLINPIRTTTTPITEISIPLT